MPIGIETSEATDIESNEMTLHGKVTDMDGNDLVLVYFEYGEEDDLSDGEKSHHCNIVQEDGSFKLKQGSIYEDTDYYFRAVAQNYEDAESQLDYLIDRGGTGLLENESLADIVMPNETRMKHMFERYEPAELYDKNGTVEYHYDSAIPNVSLEAENSTDEEDIAIRYKPYIDFYLYNTLYVDFENNGDSNNTNNKTYILLYDKEDNKIEKIYSTSRNFGQKTEELDISDIDENGYIVIRAADEFDDNDVPSRIKLYDLWIE